MCACVWEGGFQCLWAIEQFELRDKWPNLDVDELIVRDHCVHCVQPTKFCTRAPHLLLLNLLFARNSLYLLMALNLHNCTTTCRCVALAKPEIPPHAVRRGFKNRHGTHVAH